MRWDWIGKSLVHLAVLLDFLKSDHFSRIEAGLMAAPAPGWGSAAAPVTARTSRNFKFVCVQ